jgi:hypothetical protein
MATLSVTGLSVTLGSYQWEYLDGRQFGVRNEGTTDYGVLHREITGTIQRKLTVRFAQGVVPIEALRTLAIKAGRNALPVTFTDEAGASFVVDWPESHEFLQELENRRDVQLLLLEQSPGV